MNSRRHRRLKKINSISVSQFLISTCTFLPSATPSATPSARGGGVLSPPRRQPRRQRGGGVLSPPHVCSPRVYRAQWTAGMASLQSIVHNISCTKCAPCVQFPYGALPPPRATVAFAGPLAPLGGPGGSPLGAFGAAPGAARPAACRKLARVGSARVGSCAVPGCNLITLRAACRGSGNR